MKKVVALAGTMFLGIVAVSSVTAAPPVRQELGLPDVSFLTFTSDTCSSAANCHTSIVKPLENDPRSGAWITLVNRHHSPNDPTKQAQRDNCGMCHPAIPGSPGAFDYTWKNCMDTGCHAGAASPHHTTLEAKNEQCSKNCHKLLDAVDDQHYIPSGTKSAMVPNEFGRMAGTTLVGGCAVCHQDKVNTNRSVDQNKALHHDTGLGTVDTKQCLWCHNLAPGSTSNTNVVSEIRKCEACHGEKSLHSIQADSPNTANLGQLMVYQEDAGYGHVGNAADCRGCHSSVITAAGAPSATAMIPQIDTLNQVMFNTGTAATLTLTGSAFSSCDGSLCWNAVVHIKGNGQDITLQPFSVTESQVKVLMPTDLAGGTYAVTAVVDGTIESNRKFIFVNPVKIATVSYSSKAGTLTITGSKFGATPPPANATQLGVFLNGKRATVLNWSDTQIKVKCTTSKYSPVSVRTHQGYATK